MYLHSRNSDNDWHNGVFGRTAQVKNGRCKYFLHPPIQFRLKRFHLLVRQVPSLKAQFYIDPSINLHKWSDRISFRLNNKVRYESMIKQRCGQRCSKGPPDTPEDFEYFCGRIHAEHPVVHNRRPAKSFIPETKNLPRLLTFPASDRSILVRASSSIDSTLDLEIHVALEYSRLYLRWKQQ
jgi:hypothetical protein